MQKVNGFRNPVNGNVYIYLNYLNSISSDIDFHFY